MLNRGDQHRVHEGLSSRPNTDSYSHTTLISRPIALNSGSPVYTSTFSRFASAAAKQSAQDIFFATFNCPASSDSSWSTGTISVGPECLTCVNCDSLLRLRHQLRLYNLDNLS